nr:prepilin-type N-terminal cleavage/methylation domain-containing protein [Paenibacillus bovis]
MVKKIRQALKNEKGLTLVELLAVVVILGIISAIAIPSIGGLINNSKKDAHLANGQQMVNAAKLALIEDDEVESWTLQDLISKEYLEPVKDPSGGEYAPGSIVKKGENGSFTVTLVQKDSKHQFYSGDPFELKRGDVTLPK